MNILYMILIVVFLNGCSNQQMYEALQLRNQQDCYSLPVARQHECLQNARSISYEEYKRERDKSSTNTTE